MTYITEEQFGTQIEAIETRMDTRIDRIEEEVTSFKEDTMAIRKDIGEIRTMIDRIEHKLNVDQSHLTVEKAYTEFYRWVATSTIFAAAVGLTVLALVRSAGATSRMPLYVAPSLADTQVAQTAARQRHTQPSNEAAESPRQPAPARITPTR
ncbi:MAG TPA: hypothetical protein VL424_09335 [Pararobbsia sp.]|jgi:hypothetical protein|nr:hypothetical protein [Pararobbsia sp.]